MDYMVHGILQAGMLEWIAITFSRGSSQPRDQTQVSCIASRFFTNWATREAQDWYITLPYFHFLLKKKLQEVTRSYLRIYGVFLLAILLPIFWRLSQQRIHLQCRRPRFHPCVGKIPWRKKWQLTPVFLPGKSQTEEPGRLQSLGLQGLNTTDSEETLTATLLQIDFPENRYWDEIAVQEYF